MRVPQKPLSINLGNHRAKIIARRNALAAENLGLAVSIAQEIHAALLPCFELEDLIQAGQLGLLEAATSYRPSQHGGTPFGSYAYPRIRGAILDSIRRRNYLDATMEPIEEAVEIPAPDHAIVVSIDRARARQRVSEKAHQTLTAEQLAVIDAYYSPASPSLATVALQLNLPAWRAYKAHSEALAILRRELTAA